MCYSLVIDYRLLEQIKQKNLKKPFKICIFNYRNYIVLHFNQRPPSSLFAPQTHKNRLTSSMTCAECA